MTSFVVTIRILATVLPAIAVSLTSLRLYYRWSRHHLGWDDVFAAAGLVCSFFLCAGAWTRSDSPQVGPFHHSAKIRVLGYYMLNAAFTCVLWAARASILCSIIRLIPYMMRMRIYAYMAAVLFGLMWAALFILKIAICETDTSWKQQPGIQCVLGPAVAGFELGTDIFSDLILIFMPTRLLWNIKLSPSRRILLTGIFSASMLTTIVSIIHGVYVFSPDRNAEGVWAHVLASTAMMVCNLAVLVTWFIRAIGGSEGSESAPSDITAGRTTGGTPAKDLTALRFASRHNNTGPIVLHSLDRKGKAAGGHSELASYASADSLPGAALATNDTKDSQTETAMAV